VEMGIWTGGLFLFLMEIHRSLILFSCATRVKRDGNLDTALGKFHEEGVESASELLVINGSHLFDDNLSGSLIYEASNVATHRSESNQERQSPNPQQRQFLLAFMNPCIEEKRLFPIFAPHPPSTTSPFLVAN